MAFCEAQVSYGFPLKEPTKCAGIEAAKQQTAESMNQFPNP